MKDISNEEINKTFGKIFQEYRLKNNLTQEELAELLSKSTKTISQIETAKDGTSKKTDIYLMNVLKITPNTLYKSFIKDSEILNKIKLYEKIEKLPNDKVDAALKIINILSKLN